MPACAWACSRTRNSASPNPTRDSASAVPKAPGTGGGAGGRFAGAPKGRDLRRRDMGPRASRGSERWPVEMIRSITETSAYHRARQKSCASNLGCETGPAAGGRPRSTLQLPQHGVEDEHLEAIDLGLVEACEREASPDVAHLLLHLQDPRARLDRLPTRDSQRDRHLVVHARRTGQQCREPTWRHVERHRAFGAVVELEVGLKDRKS